MTESQSQSQSKRAAGTWRWRVSVGAVVFVCVALVLLLLVQARAAASAGNVDPTFVVRSSVAAVGGVPLHVSPPSVSRITAYGRQPLNGSPAIGLVPNVGSPPS